MIGYKAAHDALHTDGKMYDKIVNNVRLQRNIPPPEYMTQGIYSNKLNVVNKTLIWSTIFGLEIDTVY